MRSRQFWLAGLAAGVLAWGAAATVPALRLADNWLGDLARIFLAPTPPDLTDIVIVAITEDTLATLPYRSPVNRNLLADIVEKATAARAAGLAIDILFDQPTEESADGRLREALVGAARVMPVVLAYAMREDKMTDAQIDYLYAFANGLERGVINLPEDPDDGIVRWRQVRRLDPSGNVVPGFAAALADQRISSVDEAAPYVTPLAYSRAGAGAPAEIVSYPAHAVAVVPDEWLAGKFLFVGADLPHVDRHRTPFSALSSGAGTVPGVVIHAHGFNQLRAGIEWTDLPGWTALALALATALAVAGAFGIQRGLTIRVSLSVGVVAIYAGAAALAAARGGLFMPLVAPALAAVLAGAIQGGREWTMERRRRAFIHNAFAKYLSPAVVKLLVDEPERLRLGGEERELSYVFTDLAGFTSFTERTKPEVLVEVLNSYLDNMCRIALEHEATIDKIVGDAVVAFFGAPIVQADHAQRSVRLALAYDGFAEGFRRQLKDRGLEIGVTRVGVHTGRAIVGNFGGSRFFNYTGHGDTVNTAARMESVNKHLGTRICVSGVTAARCLDIAFRPIGTLVLVGKTQGLDCLEPVNDEKPGYAPRADYITAFDRMAAGDSAAAALFAALAVRYPEDPLVVLHAKRLAQSQTGARLVMTDK